MYHPKAHDTSKIPRTEDVLIDKCSFEDLGLNSRTLKGLHGSGFQIPSPIQYRAIPIGLCGFDLVIQAKSGTGKTLVFGVICLETIQTETSELQALILSPTREIAVQTQQLLQEIGSGLKNLKVEAFIGGLPIEDDRNKLMGCHIAVGAPGRVKHLLVKKVLNPHYIKLFILDEADQLVCENFIEDVRYIFGCLPNKKQFITASATYSTEFLKFMDIYMNYPSIITPKYEVPILLGVKQFVSILSGEENTEAITKELIRIFNQISFEQCIVFTNTKLNAQTLNTTLKKLNWPCDYLTADNDQIMRLSIIEKLKNFKCRILITTDLMARGIDAENVNLVINIEVPLSHATYLHRIGRAGRYGTYGIAVTVLNSPTELEKFKTILYKIGGDKMSVDILPRDRIPNLWDSKSKNELEKFSVGSSMELPSKIEYDDPYMYLELNDRNINDNDVLQNLSIQKEGNVPSINSNESYSNGLESENGSLKLCISMNNEREHTLDFQCFDELGEEFNTYTDNDVEIKSENNIKAVILSDEIPFNKKDISTKLINESYKPNFSIENLNSLISGLDMCDITNSSISLKNNDEKSIDDFDNRKKINECSNVIKLSSDQDNGNFVTKLRAATADLNEKLFDEDGLEENILRKNTTEEKPKLVTKLKPVNTKQLDDDRIFLEKLRLKSSVGSSQKIDSGQIINSSQKKTEHKDIELAKQFDNAVANVDSDTFSYKLKDILIKSSNRNFNDAVADIDSNTFRFECDLVDISPDTRQAKSNATDRKVLKAFKKCKADILEASTLSQPKLHIDEGVDNENTKNIDELKIYAESLLDKLEDDFNIVNESEGDTNINYDSGSCKEILTPIKNKSKKSCDISSSNSIENSVHIVNSNKKEEIFLKKLRDATADLNDILNSEDKNDLPNAILKKKILDETSVPINQVLQPKPVDEKQLEADRIFLDMIKLKSSGDTITNKKISAEVSQISIAMDQSNIGKNKASNNPTENKKGKISAYLKNNAIDIKVNQIPEVIINSSRNLDYNLGVYHINTPTHQNNKNKPNYFDKESTKVHDNLNTSVCTNKNYINNKEVEIPKFDDSSKQAYCNDLKSCNDISIETKTKEHKTLESSIVDINNEDVQDEVGDVVSEYSHNLSTKVSGQRTYTLESSCNQNDDLSESRKFSRNIPYETRFKDKCKVANTKDDNHLYIFADEKSIKKNHDKNLEQQKKYDPMLAYKKWNQMWMQQVWQINNHIIQDTYCKNMYDMYYN